MADSPIIFKSSLQPSEQGFDACQISCNGNWFGWTSPVQVPGVISTVYITNSVGIQVGAVPPPAFYAPYGSQFSFLGGVYRDKFISAQLTPGRWRIFGYWNSAPSGFDPSALTSLLVKNSFSLVDANEGLVQALTLLGPSEFSSPYGRGFSVDASNPNSFGGLDGCGHFYDQQTDIRLAMAVEITINPNQVLYLKAIASPNAQQVADSLTAIAGANRTWGTWLYNTTYQIGGFSLTDCRCGGWLQSSQSVFGV